MTPKHRAPGPARRPRPDPQALVWFICLAAAVLMLALMSAYGPGQ